jgi:hypothetical protein
MTNAVDLLLHDGPAAGRDLSLFGQFVGAWDVDVTYHDYQGQNGTRPGEWVFFWALEGQAVQDVWRVPPRAQSLRTGAPVFGHGTTIRFPDRAEGEWRCVWIGVAQGEVIQFVGRQSGEEIHLTHSRPDGVVLRWAFSDITADRFRWRFDRSADGGHAWALLQEMRARRRG